MKNHVWSPYHKYYLWGILLVLQEDPKLKLRVECLQQVWPHMYIQQLLLLLPIYQSINHRIPLIHKSYFFFKEGVHKKWILYPINEQMAKFIGPKTFIATHMSPKKVNERYVQRKCNLRFLKIHLTVKSVNFFESLMKKWRIENWQLKDQIVFRKSLVSNKLAL